MSANAALRPSWTEWLAIGLCPLFLRFGWTPILRAIHPARHAIRRASPLFEAAPGCSFRCPQPCPRCRREAHDDNQPMLCMAACLFRPTKRGDARRESSLAGRGYAPHKPTGPWGGLFRLGTKFDLRLPPGVRRPSGEGAASTKSLQVVFFAVNCRKG